jgi:hypothetical protein
MGLFVCAESDAKKSKWTAHTIRAIFASFIFSPMRLAGHCKYMAQGITKTDALPEVIC